MTKQKKILLALSIGILVTGCLKTLSNDQTVPRITKEEVRAMIGRHDVVIFDVRLNGEWNNSQWKIKGAIHKDPENLASWANMVPKEDTLVFYCS